MVTPELLREILSEIRKRQSRYAAIPEQFPILRTLQLVTDHTDDVVEILSGGSGKSG